MNTSMYRGFSLAPSSGYCATTTTWPGSILTFVALQICGLFVQTPTCSVDHVGCQKYRQPSSQSASSSIRFQDGSQTVRNIYGNITIQNMFYRLSIYVFPILYINFGERTQSIMEIQWYHRLSPADVGPEIACVNWETRIPKYGCTTKTATIDVKKQLQRVLVNNICFILFHG